MRIERNQSSNTRLLLSSKLRSLFRRAEPEAWIYGGVAPDRGVAAKSPHKILLATSTLFLLLLLGIAFSAWAGEVEPGGSKTAARAQATVKSVKLRTRRKSHSRAKRSHHRHRSSRKHRTRTRAVTPRATIERVHAVRRRARHSAVKPVTDRTVAVVPQIPAPPPMPDWPANDKPAAAAVNWNGRELTISAKNSSLSQILADVSTATGVKVEGESGDQRVYGVYGPASAQDVLNQLLDGSGYNIVMIGDSGEGTPRELVLSRKVKLTAANRRPDFAATVPDDDGEDDAEQPEPAEPVRRRPFATPWQPPPGQQSNPQTPQEQLQRLQQLQQQLQQRAMPADSPSQPPQPNEQ